MKNKILYKSLILSLAIVICVGTSCTEDFEEMNTHPFQPTETSSNFLFNGMMSYVKWPGNFWLYGMNQRIYQWAQLAASSGGGQGADADDNPNTYNTLGSEAMWNNFFNMARTYRALEEKLLDDFDQERVVNRIALMKIVWAYQALQTTDMYGDIPYFETGLGAIEELYRPKYDTQEEIYKDALSQLKWASDNIVEDYNSNVTSQGNKYLDYGSNDIMYRNDMGKWKRFANTIRLRYALRMSNVDATLAKEHGSDALAQGIMEDSGDEFIFSPAIGVSAGSYWSFQYYAEIRLGENAWKYMNADDDPAVDGSDIIDPRVAIWYETNEDDEWVAMPQSWGNTDRPDPASGHPYDDQRRNDNDDTGNNYKGNFSGFNWYMVEDGPNSYEFHVTFAEACFLTAEGILKGWGGSGSAQSWYEAGIKSSVDRWYTYGRSHEDWATPPDMPTEAELDAFVAHPRIAYQGDGSDGLLQVHIQRWLDYHYNAAQAWYLVRRVGNFPLLPVKHRVTGADVPMARRFPYPQNEVNQNADNYFDQVNGRMNGEDLVTTNIWWEGN